jgi:hypothetical protein
MTVLRSADDLDALRSQLLVGRVDALHVGDDHRPAAAGWAVVHVRRAEQVAGSGVLDQQECAGAELEGIVVMSEFQPDDVPVEVTGTIEVLDESRVHVAVVVDRHGRLLMFLPGRDY